MRPASVATERASRRRRADGWVPERRSEGYEKADLTGVDETADVDDVVRRNRDAWNIASRKHVDEAKLLVGPSRGVRSLTDDEQLLLSPLLERRPLVVHLQSGDGRDDIDLVALGARCVVGVDFSEVAVGAATARAIASSAAVRYAVGEATRVPLRSAFADIVYTGKGALMWLPDLTRWADEVARILKPGGALFVYDAHPAAALWTRDDDRARINADVDYFGGTRVNDTFPASAIARFGSDDRPDAVEFQWPLSAIVTAIVDAGLVIAHLGEYPEPFWRPPGPTAAAWDGTLPNAFSLLARKALT